MIQRWRNAPNGTQRVPGNAPIGSKMSTLRVWLLALSLLWATAGVVVAESKVAQVTFPVEGMVCPFCAASVERVLGDVGGVVAADASFIEGNVHVTYDPVRVTPEQMVTAINTNTLYRAYLPGPDAVASTATAVPHGQLPLVLAGGFILIGIGAWWIGVRWRARQAGDTPM